MKLGVIIYDNSNDICFGTIPIHRERDLEDCVIWKKSIAGTYTTQVGYT
jgi:hypothetical protein